MLWRKLTGAWWCDHCETYHGRRVHKFMYHDFVCNTHIDKYMCSLGRNAMLAERRSYEDLLTAEAKIEHIKQAANGLNNMAKQVAQAARDINKDLAN